MKSPILSLALIAGAVALALPSSMPRAIEPTPDHIADIGKLVAPISSQVTLDSSPQPVRLIEVPATIKPPALIKATATQATAIKGTGHYETRQTCGRGGCSSYSVWVPHAQAGTPAQPAAQGRSFQPLRRLFGRRR